LLALAGEEGGGAEREGVAALLLALAGSAGDVAAASTLAFHEPAVCLFPFLQVGQSDTLYGAENTRGLLFFECLFLSFRTLFSALFTFPNGGLACQRHAAACICAGSCLSGSAAEAAEASLLPHALRSAACANNIPSDTTVTHSPCLPISSLQSRR
jgi:hypothetical protein